MKILVTGTAGFIGSFLTRALISLDHSVVGIDNFHPYYSKKAKNFNLDLIRFHSGQDLKEFTGKSISKIYSKLSEKTETKKSKGYFKFIECDIRKYRSLAKIIKQERITHIVHLAAMAGVPYSIEKPREYVEVNIDGTTNLLDIAVKNKISNFIFASSSSVYGASQKVPFIETQNVDNPISPYAATKRMGEILCYTFSYLYLLPITCLRFFTVYGPLQRPYGMAIQKFIRQTDKGEPMTVYGDGTMSRDYTYIDDTVRGIISALNKPQRYQIYNLGNSHPVSLKRLTALITKYMQKGKTEYLDKPSTEVPTTYANISKAQKELSYKPEVTIEPGLKRQIEIYKSMPKWYKELEV
ncbi:MAG: NAD-dependent epimerase/dehydratase family protein [Candidatus Dojkabacteria bacterium]|jgi:UDP-glucuronate 4-epimerase|nr:NAD-dependent epimerase/dehydratase family protein [Candidatus Dojkabacteria bacterium]